MTVIPITTRFKRPVQLHSEWQFSLREMLVLTTALCVVASVWGYGFHLRRQTQRIFLAEQEERTAKVEAILPLCKAAAERGANVRVGQHGVHIDFGPSGPASRIGLLHYESAAAPTISFSDEDIDLLCDFPYSVSVDVTGSGVTAQGIERFLDKMAGRDVTVFPKQPRRRRPGPRHPSVTNI
jgi:hypothetical protein